MLPAHCRYPTAFSGNERLVSVTGEAYFEVARNNKQPFKVNVNGKATVEVLEHTVQCECLR